MYILKDEKFIPNKRIEREAECLIAAYERRIQQEILTLPVPVEKIAQVVLDFDVEYVEEFPEIDEDDTLGMIKPNSRLIQINYGLLSERPFVINFTIAHEIGHNQLHFAEVPENRITEDAQTFFVLRNGNKTPREYQAEYFAGALTMPKKLLQKATLDVPPRNWDAIRRLSEQFEVSKSAMKVRLEQLNYFYMGEDGKFYISEQVKNGQMVLPNFF